MNTESQILNVPIEDIVPNRFQPRLNFDDTALKELAESIKNHGIIQPLVLRRVNDKYEIIAGERRYRAAKIAGLTSVPAIISIMNDKESAEVAIVENIQRKDLTSIEEAKSYKSLLDQGYLTQEELARKMGISQSAISNKLRLLSLPESVQKALMEGKISERHARSLLQIPDNSNQEVWLQKIINERLTVRELDKRIKQEFKITPEISVEEKNIVKENDEMNNKIENIIQTLNNRKEENPIPNKFFNFLEDEEANMSSEEIKTDTELTSGEDIEMLDFLAPSESTLEPLESLTPFKDMTQANNLVEKLKTDLQDNNYQIEFVKEDNISDVKYIITIKKED